MTNPRKPSVILRFCEYELEEIDRLVRTYGGLPRSSIVNIALETFLHSAKESDFQKCKKRKVSLVIDPDKLNRLTQHAKTYSAPNRPNPPSDTQLQVDIRHSGHESCNTIETKQHASLSQRSQKPARDPRDLIIWRENVPVCEADGRRASALERIGLKKA